MPKKGGTCSGKSINCKSKNDIKRGFAICFYVKSRKKSMNMIDWKAKLTSRKLWVAVSEFIAMQLAAFGLAAGRMILRI